MLPLKKAKRETEAQRSPAHTKREKPRFFRETTVRTVWNVKRFKLKMFYDAEGIAGWTAGGETWKRP